MARVGVLPPPGGLGGWRGWSEGEREREVQVEAAKGEPKGRVRMHR